MAKVVSIQLDKERHLKLNLNAMVVVEELSGMKMSDLGSVGLNMSLMRVLLYAGLKHEDKELTLEDVGELIDFDNMEDVSNKLGEAMGGLK